MSTEFAKPSDIRQHFAEKMSEMYREEVPAYGQLIQLVESVNQKFLEQNPKVKNHLQETNQLNRLSEERHGAIRVGTADELRNIKRLFAVMGMHPVGYYDLSVAGLPVHSTAFRPITHEELTKNPFRVFTSLLRLDLIENVDLREDSQRILEGRSIFTAKVLVLIEQAENQGGLSRAESLEFVDEALETFRWHQTSLTTKETYEQLHRVHPLIADIVAFRGPHINHLTPRTLDIDACQEQMLQHHIEPKAVVEGPPFRKCPILLRQTSFKALSESVVFWGHESSHIKGKHTARFGEIEQRGVALTTKGRLLYDQLLDKVRSRISPLPDGSNTQEYNAILKEEFLEFPDSHEELHKQGLAYYMYRLKEGAEIPKNVTTLQQLQEEGLLHLDPIIYEDFLPVSAAGIFLSNLGNQKDSVQKANPNQAKFEEDLGCSVIDEFQIYETMSNDSRTKIESIL